jgi:ribonuclease P protein component
MNTPREPKDADPSFGFPRSARLTHDREYEGVYAAKVRKSGPLIALWIAPVPSSGWRLGLSVSKKVGMAHERTRCKRLVREAFRLDRNTWPLAPGAGHDIIVSVRSRDGMTLDSVRRELTSLVLAGLHELSRRKGRAL